VDLRLLAVHLRAKLGRNADPADAREWLVRAVRHAATRACQTEASGDRQSYGEADYPSPFRATAEFELFECDDDPRDLLEASEIVAVWELRAAPQINTADISRKTKVTSVFDHVKAARQ
jgi:hypothetical protein